MPRTASSLLLAAFASFALPAWANPTDAEGGPGRITVPAVRSADEARAIVEQERANLPRPELTIGMAAPALAISKWVKGDSVSQFEAGHAYVVEFWATWCGPCVRAFPHVSEIQARHADDLTVIGVNIWDRKRDRQTREYTETLTEQSERVVQFVGEQGDRMAYTVAIEEPDRMAETWMRAAGQNGIPAAFVVDRGGKVAWIGHPMEIDAPLEKILAGEWDLASAATEFERGLESGNWHQHLMSLLTDASTAERGYRLAYALLRTPFANETGYLNAIAWSVLTSGRIPVRDPDLAIAFAAVACEKTEWKDASVIDTLARGYFEKGDLVKAIELQTRAVDAAGEDSPMAKDLTETLMKYRAAADE
jgi:thiol-disulfide isomerase/thioredoxin